jgi:hypothetical protein
MVPTPETPDDLPDLPAAAESHDLRALAHGADALPPPRRNELIRAAALGIHQLWREGATLADAHPMTWRFTRQGERFRLAAPLHGFERTTAPMTIDRLIHRFASWRAELTGLVDDPIMGRFLCCFLQHEPVGPGRANLLVREIEAIARRLRPAILNTILTRYRQRAHDPHHPALARLATDLRLPLLPQPPPAPGVIPAATWLRHALAAGHPWTGITAIWEQTAQHLDQLGFTLPPGPILQHLYVVTGDQEEPLRPVALDPATLLVRPHRRWLPAPTLAERLDSALQSLLRTAARPR